MERALHGVSAAPGVALGVAVVLDRPRPFARTTIAPAARGREVDRANAALQAAARELKEIATRLRQKGRDAEAEIVETGELMAADPGLIERVQSLILGSGLPADAALAQAADFACHMDFFEEVAKFRAARRMWARIMRDRFGARDPRSWTLRFHTQTGGVTLTAQQPLTNVVRTALEAMSAVLGGTQSLHTNAYDEALGLPSRPAAELALRTQQVIAHESGAPAVVDPLGGSYYVEALTDRVEEEALHILADVDERGGAVAVIESGWMQRRIAESAYRQQRRIESGERAVVGVNRFRSDSADEVEIVKIGPKHQEAQIEALRRLRAERDAAAVAACLDRVEETARGTGNLMGPLKEALASYATIGECCDRLRRVFGEYRPPDIS